MPSLYGRQWDVLHLKAHLLSFFGRISMITEHWSISSSSLLLHKLEDARVASGAQWLPLAVLGCKYNPFSTPGNESAICFLCSEICSNIREMRGKCETTITLWYPLLQQFQPTWILNAFNIYRKLTQSVAWCSFARLHITYASSQWLWS